MTFASFQSPVLSALALTAGLYHTFNHAMFKGLLFMGAGAVLHATHERKMEGMGGLIHRMPWTSALFLIGCISISALPPFNGFVSEWLMFQAFLLSPALPSTLLNFLIPMGAALLALAASFGGGELSESAGAFGWIWLTPISHERASYSGPIVLLGLVGVVSLVFLLLHARKRTIHIGPLWDCGFEKVTPRMQYTATAV